MSDFEKLQVGRDVAQFNKAMGKAPEPDKSQMGKDDFLRLLTTQLQNQDPLKPLENDAFVAQMAQFSQLEQTVNMGKNVEGLRGDFERLQSATLIGRQITFIDPNTLQLNEGKVEAVNYSEDGKALFSVSGAEVQYKDIKKIKETQVDYQQSMEAFSQNQTQTINNK